MGYDLNAMENKIRTLTEIIINITDRKYRMNNIIITGIPDE